MRQILVVDDDRHTRLAMGIWLKQCGFRVAITDGGESGLAAPNDGTQRLPPLRARRRTFRGRGEYGLNCQGEAMRHSLLSSTLTRRRKSPAPPVEPKKADSPIMIATEE